MEDKGLYRVYVSGSFLCWEGGSARWEPLASQLALDGVTCFAVGQEVVGRSCVAHNSREGACAPRVARATEVHLVQGTESITHTCQVLLDDSEIVCVAYGALVPIAPVFFSRDLARHCSFEHGCLGREELAQPGLEWRKVKVRIHIWLGLLR
jgi:hypothetical protein